jgi:hypothetical protein
VAEGESHVVFVQSEKIGGFQYTLAPTLCGSSRDLRVTYLDRNRDRYLRRTVVTSSTSANGCQSTIAGLIPGPYELAVAGENGILAVRELSIASGATAAVLIDSPEVTVEGFLRSGDRPLAGVAVNFRAFDRSHIASSFVTDVTGYYHGSLPTEGLYVLGMSSGGLETLGREKTVEVLKTANRVDWNIEGVDLTVQVKNWDRTTPLSLAMTKQDGTQGGIMSTAYRLEVDAVLPAKFASLPSGRYLVRALQFENQLREGEPKAVSQVVELDLLPGKATVAVTLDLSASTSTLRLMGPEGSPISGGRLRTSLGNLTEVQPGLYSLASIPAGSRLVIASPGFSPHCITVPSFGEKVARLVRTINAVVELDGVTLAAFAASSISWPDMDCAIASQTLITGSKTDANERSEIFVSGLPENQSIAVHITPGPGATGSLSILPVSPGRFLVRSSSREFQR